MVCFPQDEDCLGDQKKMTEQTCKHDQIKMTEQTCKHDQIKKTENISNLTKSGGLSTLIFRAMKLTENENCKCKKWYELDQKLKSY